MNKNINNVKMDIIKKAILLGWIVTVFENDTIIIKKDKTKLNSFENNTQLLLSYLVDNNDFNISICKKYSLSVE